MGAQTKITITVPTELLELLQADIAAGDHHSLDAAVIEALEAYRATQFERRLGPERLEAFIMEGVNSGPGLDGEQVFAELIAKYEAQAAARGE
ncbi:MAG: type II toxin-antitoxin system ParD family antitoxin [Hyphomonadaceae bacterium]|nr:type II toxin-antitoxin system ParD family antitoxin [Hyphomonadaceae bacterium]